MPCVRALFDDAGGAVLCVSVVTCTNIHGHARRPVSGLVVVVRWRLVVLTISFISLQYCGVVFFSQVLGCVLYGCTAKCFVR